jgi:hypothetical protein
MGFLIPHINEANFPISYLVITYVILSGGRIRATELPRRADDFVDSFGINLDLDFNAKLYNETLLGQLGIRHFPQQRETGAKHADRPADGSLRGLWLPHQCRL